MNNIYKAHWIKTPKNTGTVVPEFIRDFKLNGTLESAELSITALGVFYAEINGKKVSGDVLAPGWTSYKHRLQYMTYDITDMLAEENNITVSVGRGWRFHKVKQWGTENIAPDGTALLCAVTLNYKDGTNEIIVSDSDWLCRRTKTVYNDIYNGETFDASKKYGKSANAVCFSHPKNILLPLEGTEIREYERFGAKLIITPKGEKVLDFGQEVTGYIEAVIDEKKGAEINIKHFEVLDRDGNVYTENLRAAKQEVNIICNGKRFTFKPKYTFYGFRYIKIEGIENVDPANFTAIAVYSNMQRTGHFECSDEMLNKFYRNIVWGQRGNFLDVPTDCPQRDERLGWTGDAQVFCRTAAINYNVEKFFDKWLADLASEQYADGGLPNTCPVSQFGTRQSSAAWTDAAVIIPWQMYLAYGNEKNLAKAYPMMKKYVDFMASYCEKNAKGTGKDFVHPWKEGFHYGDWLSLDNENPEEVNGRTDKGLIATAYLAYDLDILIKSGKLFGNDMSYYENLYEDTVRFFRSKYMENGRCRQDTQTAAVLALHFNLTDNKKETALQLAENVEQAGRLTTGFVGTAYLLHALSEAGRDDLAMNLLLKKDYPSWLYPVTMGATTVWERWNGIHPDGHFANKGMNSFNHYAYGSVFDWIFCRLCGINTSENAPGYRHIVFTPAPDKRVGNVKGSIETAYGTVRSEYKLEDGIWKFEFTVPEGCTADAEIKGAKFTLHSGKNTVAVAD